MTYLPLLCIIALAAGCASLTPDPAQLKASGADKDAVAVCNDFNGPGWSTKTRYLSVNKSVLQQGTVQVTPECALIYGEQGKQVQPK